MCLLYLPQLQSQSRSQRAFSVRRKLNLWEWTFRSTYLFSLPLSLSPSLYRMTKFMSHAVWVCGDSRKTQTAAAATTTNKLDPIERTSLLQHTHTLPLRLDLLLKMTQLYYEEIIFYCPPPPNTHVDYLQIYLAFCCHPSFSCLSPASGSKRRTNLSISLDI